MVSQRLPGHTLRDEGAPFSAPACDRDRCAEAFGVKNVAPYGGISGPGHGTCSCGEQSAHLPSGAARRRWHQTHKADIRNRGEIALEGARPVAG